MRLRTTLALAVWILSPKVQAQPSQETLEKTDALIREFVRSADGVAWLRAHRAQIDSAVASTAAAIAETALNDQRPLDALAAAQFASTSQRMLGERAEAVASGLTLQQARFLLAETPERYQVVSAASLRLSGEARQLRRPDLEFRLLTVHADATFFKSEAERPPAGDPTHLAAIEGATRALQLLPQERDRAWVERLVSLTGAIVQSSLDRYRVDQDAHNAALRRLVPVIEARIPADFAFRVYPDGEVKSHEVAYALANLSYHHGQAAKGSARLLVAEGRALSAGDLDRLLSAIWLHYRGERRANPNAPQLAELRRDALNSAQKLRATYRSRTGRLWAAYRSDSLLGEMVGDQLAATPATEVASAFSWVEELKARMLLDRFSMAPRELQTPEAKQLERAVLGFNTPRNGQGNMIAQELRLVSQLSGFGLRDDDDRREAALAKLETQYRAARLGFDQVAVPAKLAVVQEALLPGEMLVEYLEPYSDLGPRPELWIFTVTRDDARITHVRIPPASIQGKLIIGDQAPVDSGMLGDTIITARTAIREADDARAQRALAWLHGFLIQPLLDRGLLTNRVSRMIVVPHGALHYLPFPALVDSQGHYLISRLQVVVAPSASIWHALQGRTSPARNWVALVNPKVDDPSVAELQFAEQEAEWIGKQLPAEVRTVFPREAATWANLRNAAPTAGFLHFATHGQFPDDSALDLHSLLLASGPGGHGLLRAADVRQLDLRATRLVALSVCNGGLYRIGPSDEPYGLVPAFLEAGAQNVLGTLWPMDDQFGRDFMIEFYKHLASDGPSGAYQKATRHFVDDGEILRRWAGFVMVGPGRESSGMGLLRLSRRRLLPLPGTNVAPVPNP